MTIKENIGLAIKDLFDDKSQAARYLFVIAIMVICTTAAQPYAGRVVDLIVGGLLVLIGAKSRG